MTVSAGISAEAADTMKCAGVTSRYCDNSGWKIDLMYFWEYDGPMELLYRIQDKTGWELGMFNDYEYGYKGDPLSLRYQYDDLIGLTVNVPDWNIINEALAFLKQFMG